MCTEKTTSRLLLTLLLIAGVILTILPQPILPARAQQLSSGLDMNVLINQTVEWIRNNSTINIICNNNISNIKIYMPLPPYMSYISQIINLNAKSSYKNNKLYITTNLSIIGILQLLQIKNIFLKYNINNNNINITYKIETVNGTLKIKIEGTGVMLNSSSELNVTFKVKAEATGIYNLTVTNMSNLEHLVGEFLMARELQLNGTVEQVGGESKFEGHGIGIVYLPSNVQVSNASLKVESDDNGNLTSNLYAIIYVENASLYNVLETISSFISMPLIYNYFKPILIKIKFIINNDYNTKYLYLLNNSLIIFKNNKNNSLLLYISGLETRANTTTSLALLGRLLLDIGFSPTTNVTVNCNSSGENTLLGNIVYQSQAGGGSAATSSRSSVVGSSTSSTAGGAGVGSSHGRFYNTVILVLALIIIIVAIYRRGG